MGKDDVIMAENNRPIRNGEKDEGGSAHKSAARAPRQAVRRKRSGLKVLNLFDVIVIVLVLLVVVLLAVGVRVSDLFGGDQGQSLQLSYALTLYDVDEAYANAIRRGDEIYNVDTGSAMGKVTQSPTVVPHTEIALQTLEDGSVAAVEVPVPGRVNITVAVQGMVDYHAGDGYSVDGQRIRVGWTYAVRFPDYLGNAQCVSFDGASAIRN
ncbi:MAG: DUF4330 family protein [Clostridia bacterium]|nr:DUF4330 family protein [Clostridia bacterium]